MIIKSKKNIFFAGTLIIILIVALILALVNYRKTIREDKNNIQNPKINLPAPEFLSSQEKVFFKLDDNVKAQVLNRDASGAPSVYKIINTDADVITDPSKVEPISPHQSQTVK